MYLENLKTHIDTLSQSDWDKIFELIPKIEGQTQFGEDHFGEELPNGSIRFFHAWDSAPVVDETYFILSELNLVPIYDWSAWEEGHQFLHNKETDFTTLDLISLFKLFTIMIRKDRFSDGYMVLCFESGAVLKIIKAIKEQIVESKDA